MEKCECPSQCFIPDIIKDWQSTITNKVTKRYQYYPAPSEECSYLAQKMVENPVRAMNSNIINSQGEIFSTEKRNGGRYSICDITGIGVNHIHFSLGMPYAADRYNENNSKESNKVLIILDLEKISKRPDFKILPCDSGYLFTQHHPIIDLITKAPAVHCQNEHKVIYNSLQLMEEMGALPKYSTYLQEIIDTNLISVQEAASITAGLLSSISKIPQNHRVIFFPEGSVTEKISPEEVKFIICPEHLYSDLKQIYPSEKIISSPPINFIEIKSNGFNKRIAMHLLDTYFQTIGIKQNTDTLINRIVSQEPNFF